MSKLFKIILVVALSGLIIGGAFAAGLAEPAAGEEDNVTELANQTIGVDNDTEEIRVVAENTTGTLDVSISSIDEDGNETEVQNTTLDAGANETDQTSYDPTNEDYSEYRVVVEGEDVETLDIYTLELTEAGDGAGWLPETPSLEIPDWLYGPVGLAGAAVAVVGVGFIIARASGGGAWER